MSDARGIVILERMNGHVLTVMIRTVRDAIGQFLRSNRDLSRVPTCSLLHLAEICSSLQLESGGKLFAANGSGCVKKSCWLSQRYVVLAHVFVELPKETVSAMTNAMLVRHHYAALLSVIPRVGLKGCDYCHCND
eukprot:m.242231 g.242231  ORF g.242231 m.242231 type:complete len:135 (-) comp15330_c0_seq50:248-652(-)